MTEKIWYYAQGQQKVGPFSLTELRQLVAEGRLVPTDMVWHEGASHWRAARLVEELFPEASDPPMAPAADAALTQRFWLFVDGQPQGPYAREQIGTWLAAGQSLTNSTQPLTRGVLACAEASSSWKPLAEFSEFKDSSQPAPAAETAPPQELSSEQQFWRNLVDLWKGIREGAKVGSSIGAPASIVGWTVVLVAYAIAAGWQPEGLEPLQAILVCLLGGGIHGFRWGGGLGSLIGLVLALFGCGPESLARRTRQVVVGGFLLLSVGAAYFATQAASEKRYLDLLAEGNRCARAGDPEGALQAYTRALQSRPARPEAYLLRGNVYWEKRDSETALLDYQEAIRLGLRDPAVYFHRGLCHSQRQECALAIADFTEAIRLGFREGRAYLNRGWCYSHRQDYDRAIADFTEALRRTKADDPEVYYQRGLAYGKKGEHQRAIADYTEAIRLDARYALAYFHRGLQFEALGDRTRARADRAEALRLDPQLAKEAKR